MRSRLGLPEASERLLDEHVRFDGLDARSVSLALNEPMELPFGRVDSRPSGWVRLDVAMHGSTVTGFGEGATLQEPLFTDDSGKNIARNILAIGRDVTAGSKTPRDAIDRIAAFRFADGSYPTARLALEMAVIDGVAKAGSLSVASLIGVPAVIQDVHYGKSIGSGDEDGILQQVQAAIEQKAKKIKLKISPTTFLTVSRAIERIKADYPAVEIMVDANGSFDVLSREDLAGIDRLDGQGLVMIEEPVSRVGRVRGLDAVARLRSALPNMATPVCLDDCLRTRDDCERALGDGLADIVNIKPGRIGSFLGSIALINDAKAYGKQVMVGGMLEATPGRSMTSVLGAYCVGLGFTIPGDLSLAQERLAEDLVSSDKQMKLNAEGRIVLPNGHGWGF